MRHENFAEYALIRWDNWDPLGGWRSLDVRTFQLEPLTVVRNIRTLSVADCMYR